MADMIDAKEAKSLLNCDDAALNNHINSGAIRAQRVQGKLMLNKDDVAKIVRESGDEGTIVLTGDSDELSIDLGKVVDDASETIVQPRKDSSNATESITFGDELEVVSFDDGNTKDLNFDKTKSTQPGNLSFTDSNTAVMTAVDETHVGGTTGPIDFQTSQIEGGNTSQNVGGSSRRSVRSNRARAEQVKVHWIWPSLMALTLILGLALILPYYFITMMPHAYDEKDAKGNVLRGLDDNGWTNMASGVAGFSVEPDSAKFRVTHPDGEWLDMKSPEKDPQADWRFKRYQGKYTKPGERLDSFVIVEVQQEGKKAKSKQGDLYDVVEAAPATGGAAAELLKEPKVNLGLAK